MAILIKNLSKPVMDLLYDKQTEFKKKKNGSVSLEKTVEILLRDAYLKDVSPVNKTNTKP